MAKKSGQMAIFKNKSGHDFSLKFQWFADSLPTFPLFSLINVKKKTIYL